MSSEGHYCDYDFGGSDYLSPAEEERYPEQALKNAETRAEFLQDLANSHERGMLERQGKIEALEKERDALLSTIGGLKSEIAALSKKNRALEIEKTPRKQVLDYRRVDPDLLVDFAISVLENGANYDGWSSSETGDLEDEIEKKATFHPHVQQEIVRDEHGVLRFRKNALIDRLVTEAGKDSRLMGLNYIATLEASVEDRAQLAQLIGYSVDGYQSLSYSLPIEEDKIPAK